MTHFNLGQGYRGSINQVKEHVVIDFNCSCQYWVSDHPTKQPYHPSGMLTNLNTNHQPLSSLKFYQNLYFKLVFLTAVNMFRNLTPILSNEIK